MRFRQEATISIRSDQLKDHPSTGRGATTARIRGSAEPLSPRSRRQASLPDCPIVELNDHAIRRINRTLVEGINPDSACRRKPVRPCLCRHACFGQEIECRSVLCDMGR
jgi:hypothetical protein